MSDPAISTAALDDLVLEIADASGLRQPRRHLMQARHAAKIARRLFAGGAQLAFGLLQPRHIEQRDDDPPGDAAIGAAIWKQTQ